MNSLKIQQGQNIEVVSTSIIKKLYDAAQSVPLPEEGEQDQASMSGNLQVDKTYRTQVSYLTTRFPDLHINVTNSYYIPFEDSNVQSVLMANNISSDGIAVTEEDAATATLGTMFQDNTDITSFNEFKYFTRANTNPVNGMFKGCTNLSSIDLSNVTSLSAEEFRGVAIIDINAPNLITVPSANDTSIFSHNQSLQTITSLGHITFIPTAICRDCGNLQTINLPDECTEIKSEAFYCANVTGNLQTINGIEHVSSFGNSCFRNQKNLLLTAQDLAEAVTVGNYAFYNTKAQSLNCPKLTSLSSDSFSKCSITTVECLGKISSIPESAFDANSSLQTVKIPYECTSIGPWAFVDDGALTSIQQYNKSIDSYIEGESPVFTNISRVTTFGKRCFYNCNLLQLTNDDISGATSIGESAFQNTLLSGSIDLSNVTSIGASAFLGTSITSVILPSVITTIPYQLFGWCENLTNISGIENITSIQDYGLAYVYGLTGVYNFANLTSVGKQGLTGATNTSLYIPKMQYVGRGGDGTSYTYANVSIGGAYRGNNAVFNIIYLRDVVMFYGEAFVRSTIHHLVINNTTPPDWKPGPTSDVESGQIPAVFAFCTVDNIYVPDTAVSSYTAHQYWGTLSNKIHPISDLNKVATRILWDALPAADKPNTLIEEYM